MIWNMTKFAYRFASSALTALALVGVFRTLIRFEWDPVVIAVYDQYRKQIGHFFYALAAFRIHVPDDMRDLFIIYCLFGASLGYILQSTIFRSLRRALTYSENASRLPGRIYILLEPAVIFISFAFWPLVVALLLLTYLYQFLFPRWLSNRIRSRLAAKTADPFYLNLEDSTEAWQPRLKHHRENVVRFAQILPIRLLAGVALQSSVFLALLAWQALQ